MEIQFFRLFNGIQKKLKERCKLHMLMSHYNSSTRLLEFRTQINFADHSEKKLKESSGLQARQSLIMILSKKFERFSNLFNPFNW